MIKSWLWNSEELLEDSLRSMTPQGLLKESLTFWQVVLDHSSDSSGAVLRQSLSGPLTVLRLLRQSSGTPQGLLRLLKNSSVGKCNVLEREVVIRQM
jgi:hypothetical protein